MALRSLDELAEQQAALTAELMAVDAEPVVVGGATQETAAVGVWIGRVSAVVTSDEALGAHVVVVRQRLAGTPPVAGDADAVGAVAYPFPGVAVTVFAVDDYVWVRRLFGVLVVGGNA
ncbi:MAG: hypothetical protein H6817_00300 [Phycisphaerales bacterium]|nr:hypothetical protein [Phycisphaerales bacterium]